MRLFGEVALLVDDEVVTLRSAKELGLLALLAEAHPRPLTRRHALEVLWPDSDGDRGRRSLNQAVYATRRVVGADALRAHLDLISLDGSEWSCDAWDLDETVAKAAKDRVTLPRFAAGGRLPNTPGFREWIDRVRGRVEAHLVAAYCAELKKLMDRGRFEAAEPLARAALDIDPYAETALYHLAMAIASSGRITAGLAEIRAAREKFRTELGRPLPAAFGELEARLESTEAFEARRRPRPSPKTLVLPFVGREQEFAQLRAAWDGIATTGRRIVLVSGEPGIGKTRLVERLARLASIEGGRVLHADCYAAHRRVPFAAISEALRGLRPEEVAGLDTIWRRVLFTALSMEAAGTDLPPPPRLDPEAEQLRLFESVVLAVQAASAERPVLVLVDDLQWLDQSSAAVLQHLIRRCEDEPVLFVFAARERELRVDDELREFVANNRGAHFSDVELSGLDAEASVQLAREAAAGATSASEPDVSLADSLGGHPFLITQVTRVSYGREAKSFEGCRSAYIQANSALSTFLSELLGNLPRRAIEISKAIGAWGGKVPIVDLAAFLGGASQQLSESFAELETIGIIHVTNGNVTFCHSIFRDWSIHLTTQSERALLHSRIADFLDARIPIDHAQLVHHYQACSDQVNARKHAIAAASAANQTSAYSETEYFLRLVVSLSGTGRDKAEADLKLADHLYNHSNPNEALSLYRSLLGHSVAPRPEEPWYYLFRARELDIALKATTAEHVDIADSAINVLTAAEQAGETEAAIAALGVASKSLVRQSHERLSAELVRHAKRLADKTQDVASAVRSLRHALILETRSGKDEAARITLNRLTALSGRGLEPSAIAEISQAEGLYHWWLGDLISAEAVFLTALSATREWGNIGHLPSALVDLAVVIHYLGRSDAATGLLDEASTLARSQGWRSEDLTITANLVLIDYESGRSGEASRRIASAGAIDAFSAPGQEILLAIDGLLAVEQGDQARARARLEQCGNRTSVTHDPSFHVRLAAALARNEQELSAAADLAEQFQRARLPGKVCAWKVDLALAAIALRMGRRATAEETIQRVSGASRRSGALHLLKQAQEL